MKIVIDIGESQADQRQILELMAQGNLELASDIGGDDVHVGCLLVGVIEQSYEALVPYLTGQAALASETEKSR